MAAQLNVERALGEGLWLALGLGGCDGFTNFRSVWLDEYCRQQFGDLSGVEGAEDYVEANPRGVNAVVGARWKYRTAAGWMYLSYDYRSNVGLLPRSRGIAIAIVAMLAREAWSQPISAIINGIANSPSHQQWELLYTRLGYGQLYLIIEYRKDAAVSDVTAAAQFSDDLAFSSAAVGVVVEVEEEGELTRALVRSPSSLGMGTRFGRLVLSLEASQEGGHPKTKRALPGREALFVANGLSSCASL